jgi:predicted GIY-YIG superfamily endonuclease
MLNPNYVIYLLINTINNYTYIGITNNTDRRLRQHNGVLVGGAKYTHSQKGEGEWKFYGWIKGIGENILIKNRSLSLEKKIKIRSKKCKGTPLEKRLTAINNILAENLDLEFKLQD